MRTVTEKDLPALGALLARAFRDDPPTRWMLPQEDTYLERSTRQFDIQVRETFPKGGCWTNDDCSAAALWEPPGDWGMSDERSLELIDDWVAIFGDRLQIAGQTRLDMKARHPEAPHWYLFVVGVHPDHRGHGLGGELLATMIERVDAEGMPAYLEASTERNARLYERHGFEHTETWNLPDGGPPLYGMWRRAGERSENTEKPLG